jgi:hypothetical protein
MAQEFSARSRITVIFAGVLDANVSRETFLVQVMENMSRDGLFLRDRIAVTSNGAENFGESANNRSGCWVIRCERFTRIGHFVQGNETRMPDLYPHSMRSLLAAELRRAILTSSQRKS